MYGSPCSPQRRERICKGNAASLARIANVSLESAKEAIEKFQLQTPRAIRLTTTGAESAVPGGWFVLNHALYRGKDYREYEAERKREYRRSHPLSGHVRDMYRTPLLLLLLLLLMGMGWGRGRGREAAKA